MYNVDSTIVPAAGGARVANSNYVASKTGTEVVSLVVPLKYLVNC